MYRPVVLRLDKYINLVVSSCISAQLTKKHTNQYLALGFSSSTQLAKEHINQYLAPFFLFAQLDIDPTNQHLTLSSTSTLLIEIYIDQQPIPFLTLVQFAKKQKVFYLLIFCILYSQNVYNNLTKIYDMYNCRDKDIIFGIYLLIYIKFSYFNLFNSIFTF